MGPNASSASVILGLCLFAAGLGYRVPILAEWDSRTFRSINGALNDLPLVNIFGLAWPLGTTAFTLLALLVLLLVDDRAALPAAVVYLGAVLLERLIKTTLKRPRPFEALPDIEAR